MAKPPATQESRNHPVVNEDGSVSVDAFLHDKAEARIEAGIIPYYTQEEKDAIIANGTGLYILGVRSVVSERFPDKNDPTQKRTNYELSMTSDPGDPRKSGLWGGLPDSPYWQHFAPKISNLLDIAADAGSDLPRIGPVYPHERSYTNEWGTFPSYDFRETPQRDSVASGMAGAVTPATDEDDNPPF